MQEKQKDKRNKNRKERGSIRMRKGKRFVSGCIVLAAGLLLCIPVIAGGYSASSELKVNIIGICSWSAEPESVNEVSLLDEDGQPQATPSNASKSNASKSNVLITDDAPVNDHLPDKQNECLPCVSLSCAGYSDTELCRNEETDGVNDKESGD